jgi:hypothetical protein
MVPGRPRRPILTRFAFVALLLAGLASVGQPGRSEEPLPPAEGEVILLVTGAIAVRNRAEGAAFDRNGLGRMPQQVLRTSTPWTDGVPEFRGVLLRDVLERVGARGKALIGHSLTEYHVRIPIEDAQRYRVLLATSMNGKLLIERDKGPVWIVYPRDTHPELRNALADSRWVWQLTRLEVQ